MTPEGLRILPFFLYMGGADSAYNRNVVVREFSAKMDVLQAADPAGYTHRLTVFRDTTQLELGVIRSVCES